MTRTKLRSTLIATERERCAKIADASEQRYRGFEERAHSAGDDRESMICSARLMTARDIAREIRSGK